MRRQFLSTRNMNIAVDAVREVQCYGKLGEDERDAIHDGQGENNVVYIVRQYHKDIVLCLVPLCLFIQ